MLNDNDTELFDKAIAVIDSCQTFEQMVVAKNYVRRCKRLPWWMYHHLDERLDRLMRKKEG